MSTQQHNANSSLNNLPEKNAAKTSTSGSTDVMNNDIRNEGRAPVDTDEKSKQRDVPMDKLGDTWGGGIPGHNKEFK